jgi:hypothetical protein
VAARIAFVFALATAAASPAFSQAQETGAPAAEETPIQKADALPSKVTASAYIVPEEVQYDLNLKHQFGHLGAWLGVYHDPGGDDVGRIGAEYDYQRGPLLLIPTLQAGTNGLRAGQLYSELGAGSYAIVGFSRTNLKPFFNLSWDPNESVQLGAGHHVSPYDKVYAFVIFDVRLHTAQQDTHLLWRHRLDSKDGVTLDGLYKSGRTTDGRFIHAVGIGIYYDRPRWFFKAYYDPYVNFTSERMIRLAAGLKF